MSFTIDKQTLDELNLLGKFRQGSVYQIFNQTKTVGGEQLLHDMFQHPLQSAKEINDRSAVFQYFQQSNFTFSFDVQQINAMREFLETTTSKYRIVALAGTLTKKLLSGIARDERYKKMVQGIQATVVTVSVCYDLLQSGAFQTGPYSARAETVRKILDHPLLVGLRSIDIYGALPVQTLARYDYLLKGQFSAQLSEVLAFIYELDANISVSTVAREHGFNYAVALPKESGQFIASQLRHPAIKGAVGNSTALNSQQNVLFLTGANMAGKSTLMKAMGIAIYLGHMGFPVAASEMTFSIRDGLYTSINVADNIGLGYSHFYAEVIRVKQAAEAAVSGKYFFLIFDELFKGTNVKDAYDGTLEVITGLAAFRKCLIVVSTHIIEVGNAMQTLSNVQFGFMPTVMQGSTPHYTYTMQQGITQDRQGMLIIKNEGILALLDME